MFCGSCGSKLTPNDAFCPNCGAKVEHNTISKVAPESLVKTTSTQANEGVLKTKVLPKIEKRQIIDFLFWFAFFIVCVMCTYTFKWALEYGGCIKIISVYNSNVSKSLSLSQILQYMYSGYGPYSPTVASKLLSVTVYVLQYSLPVLFFIMFVGILIGNSKVLWHTSLSILNTLSAFSLIIIMPLTLKFVPCIKNIIGAETSIITEDIRTISYGFLIVFAVSILILIVVSYILLFFLLRRKQNEKTYIK